MRRKKHRLSGPRDFKALFRGGRKKDFPLFRLSVLPNHLSRARIAIVVPKSAEKRAANRNRMRRRVWEWLRTKTSVFSRSVDVGFYIKKEAFLVSRKKFYEALARAVNDFSSQDKRAPH